MNKSTTPVANHRTTIMLMTINRAWNQMLRTVNFSASISPTCNVGVLLHLPRWRAAVTEGIGDALGLAGASLLAVPRCRRDP